MILSYCFENEKTGTHLRTRFLSVSKKPLVGATIGRPQIL